MIQLNIVFAGTPTFGLPCLRAIADSQHHLKAIYTQPDRPAGRGRQLQASPIKQWGLDHDIPIYQPENFKNPDDQNILASLNSDLLVVIAYGLLLPERILNTPRYGCINVHASVLPRWRGASPIQQAILHGDPETGITIMQMDKGLDTGPMLAQNHIAITAHETAESLHDKLAQSAPSLLMNTIDAIATQQAKATHQNNSLATYAPKISKEDAKINWHLSAENIERQIRAFNPWPVCYTESSSTRLRIYEAKTSNIQTSAPPGAVVGITEHEISVATGQGVLNISRLQFAGGKVLAVSDWFKAKRPLLEKGMLFL